jgi:glutathione peroxidase
MDFYSQTINTSQAKALFLQDFKGKLVLILNTATQCGFTPQFEGLEMLYQK